MGRLIIKIKMRRYKITIRELAARLDMPMTKIRYGLKHGVSCMGALEDWLEAITR